MNANTVLLSTLFTILVSPLADAQSDAPVETSKTGVAGVMTSAAALTTYGAERVQAGAQTKSKMLAQKMADALDETAPAGRTPLEVLNRQRAIHDIASTRVVLPREKTARLIARHGGRATVVLAAVTLGLGLSDVQKSTCTANKSALCRRLVEHATANEPTQASEPTPTAD